MLRFTGVLFKIQLNYLIVEKKGNIEENNLSKILQVHIIGNDQQKNILEKIIAYILINLSFRGEIM